MENGVLSRGVLLLIGGALSAAVALAGVRARALTADGAAAAVFVGTLVVGFGGLGAGALLFTFFVTSSLLTRWRAERKHHPEHRAGRRAPQVLANGAIAAGASIWWGLTASPAAAAAVAGAIAAASADTLATELGLVSPTLPRLITSGREVPPGTSGAVSWMGTLAGVVGAMIVALGGLYLLNVPATAVLLAGILGMAVDSILGATVEGTTGWMNNDAVNLLATLTGALVSAAFLTFVPGGAQGGVLLLIMFGVLALSPGATIIWMVRREHGLRQMWRSMDRDARAAFMTLALRQAGFGVFGIALLAAGLARVWLDYLLVAGLALLVLTTWPLRLLITRWIK